jgi:hypothetical protein
MKKKIYTGSPAASSRPPLAAPISALVSTLSSSSRLYRTALWVFEHREQNLFGRGNRSLFPFCFLQGAFESAAAAGGKILSESSSGVPSRGAQHGVPQALASNAALQQQNRRGTGAFFDQSHQQVLATHIGMPQ